MQVAGATGEPAVGSGTHGRVYKCHMAISMHDMKDTMSSDEDNQSVDAAAAVAAESPFALPEAGAPGGTCEAGASAAVIRSKTLSTSWSMVCEQV